MSLYQKYLSVIKNLLGKHIDQDMMYGNHCVDFVRRYALDIGCPITTYWNARWFATIWLWPNWERVDEGWVWDIVVQPRGTYWHIAVVSDIRWNTLYVHEQNRDGKASSTTLWSPVALGKYIIRWDEVYFRPIIKKKRTPAPNPIRNGKRTNPKSVK
jgi:surface antigen